MKALFRKIKQRKEGSSLVSVIIGVVFLATIGITILTMATKYIVTVYVDRNSTDNFYQTEGILTEVKTGLSEYAGDASEVAYKATLESYGASTKADMTNTGAVSSMKAQFAKAYLGEIVARLTGLASYTWDDAKIGTIQNMELDSLKKLTNEPDAVKAVDGKNVDFIITEDSAGNYSLTIENLLIDYTDAADYRSTIQTDLVVTVPDYKFQGDSTLNQIKNFVSISDDKMEIFDNLNGIHVKGNVYTGATDESVVVKQNSKVDFNSETMICRGDLDVFTGAKVNIQGGKDSTAGELWVKNIRLKAAGDGGTDSVFTSFNMKENAYVSNDLSIDDKYTQVNLAGKYYGYSYNQENSSSSSELKAEYSSAILINGVNTLLDGSGLDQLILAGRSFVSGTNDGTNIMMGESVAPKSNQLAYLVPDSYISAGHNPVAGTETYEIDETALKADYGAYLDASKPYVANYSNNPQYVFFYLNFASDVKANQYFKNYYEGSSQDEDGIESSNREELKEKATTYIATKDSEDMKLSGNLYLIAGNIVENYYSSGGSGIQEANYYQGTSPIETLLADGKQIGLNYVNKQLYLSSSGDASSMRIAEDAPKLVKDSIIDFSKISATLSKQDTSSGGTVYVTSGDYIVTDTGVKKGIIVAKGDVEVQSDFEGLILAGGTVTVNRNEVKMNADISLVDNLLTFIEGDSELSAIFRGLNGSKKQETTNINECIKYSNWTKNTY